MSGIIGLNELINSLSPHMQADEYAFCTVIGSIADYAALDPVAFVKEEEGLTLVLPVAVAVRERFKVDRPYKNITLMVHSSLEAVGLTAAVSSKLASCGISANILAGYYHDHVFVPSDKAEEALELLQGLSNSRPNC